ncbi:MAG: lamin tail domain-containing protein [Bacteroidales bacterium]|jgi:hypothetical protein|nr:lamin tail domain-containing protein [Bacteroidales bacterium]
MKKIILLLLMFPCLMSAQIIDSFEDGLSELWSQQPEGRWSADQAGALSGNMSLHHTYDNTDAGIDRIMIPVKDIHPTEGSVTWSFKIRHGNDPSQQNNWHVFLFADRGVHEISPDKNFNGYALGVNLTGSDDTLRLWKVKGTQLKVVVNTKVNWQLDIGSTQYATVTIERLAGGEWNVRVYDTGSSLLKETEGVDAELFLPAWFGLAYKYTSTQDRKLWIDDIDIDGVFYADTKPPAVTETALIGRKSLSVYFDEEPASEFFNSNNFILDNNSILSVTRTSTRSAELKFLDEFPNKSLNKLTVKNICDVAGNCADTTIEFMAVWAEPGDIVISEIMADPLPAVSLPDREYIELSNTTGFAFNLGGWKLISGEQNAVLPNIIAEAGEIIILCSASDTALFKQYGKTYGIRQFSLLTDEGKLLALVDTSGVLIHGVEYSNRWYGNNLKSDGGWSLEMIDVTAPFNTGDNWTASVSRSGGTPGTVNSVARKNNDNTFEGIKNIFAHDNSNLTVVFSEPVINPEAIGNSNVNEKIAVTETVKTDVLLRKFDLKLSAPLENGQIYTFRLPGDIKDFAGNRPLVTEFRFGLTEDAAYRDVMFNELLFNPLPGDQDYIELHNCSGKIIDASRLLLARIIPGNSDTSSLVTVSPVSRCILPGEYFVLTIDRQKVIDRYPAAVAKNIYELPSLPAMPDDEGTLLLLNRELDLVDKVAYSKNMHNQLLSGNDGIALEKVNECGSSEEPSNWHSATEPSGWGTPGTENSYVNREPLSQGIHLSSTRITPNNDGIDDYLSVSFALNSYDNVISVWVYSEAGTLVNKVASNMLIPEEANITWDGTASDGTPVTNGIYIIYITWFSTSGKTESLKKVCTVLR